MEPHEKELLEETAKLSEENNKMLRSMLRATRWGQVLSVTKWIIIIGLTVGAYYYIQPYLDLMLKMYKQIGDGAGISLPNCCMCKIQDVLKKF